MLKERNNAFATAVIRIDKLVGSERSINWQAIMNRLSKEDVWSSNQKDILDSRSRLGKLFHSLTDIDPLCRFLQSYAVPTLLSKMKTLRFMIG